MERHPLRTEAELAHAFDPTVAAWREAFETLDDAPETAVLVGENSYPAVILEREV